MLRKRRKVYSDAKINFFRFIHFNRVSKLAARRKYLLRSKLLGKLQFSFLGNKKFRKKYI